jgi:hypothetical protein
MKAGAEVAEKVEIGYKSWRLHCHLYALQRRIPGQG